MKAMLRRLVERLAAEAGAVPVARLRGHRPHRGARLRGRGRPRGLGQEHLPAPPRARLVVLPGRGRHRPRAGAGRAAARHVRHLHRLPGRLPHRRPARALRARRHALHQLPDDRGQGRHPRGAPRGRGPPRVRLRHLPGRLPLEPAAAPRRRPTPSRPATGLVAPDLGGAGRPSTRRRSAQRFRKSPVKRAKRRGLLRNVAVALGNAGDAARRPVLERLAARRRPRRARARRSGPCAGWTLGDETERARS